MTVGNRRASVQEVARNRKLVALQTRSVHVPRKWYASNWFEFDGPNLRFDGESEVTGERREQCVNRYSVTINV